MIVFELKCDNNHQFESWFRSSAAYEELQRASLVACPYCSSVLVKKALMAPNVAVKGNRKTVARSHSEGRPAPTPTPPTAGPPQVMSGAKASPDLMKLVTEAAEMITKIQQHVQANCDNVGDQFAEEARKIHYGETDARGIYGTASAKEAEELMEEGIDLMPLPALRRADA